MRAEHIQQCLMEAYPEEASAAPPQVNPVDLISRDNKIHVGDWFHTDGTGMDRVSTYSKGKFRYLGDQDSRGILEGGEGSD